MNERNDIDKLMEEALQSLQSEQIDILAPDFDKPAYIARLKEKHTQAMQEVSKGKDRTWSIQPQALDIYSPEFDPESYVEELILQAKSSKKINELIEEINTLPHSTKEDALAAIAERFLTPREIKRTGGRRVKTLDIPLDKPNSQAWNMLTVTTGGQIAFATEKAGSKKEVSVIYSIDFDELQDTKITKALEPFDKRVYIAVAALFNAGNVAITLNQVYNAMGFTGTAGQYDRIKINTSITKMASARVFMDNVQEVTAGYKYPQFRYDGQLLPMERIEAVINGQFAESVIHLLKEPPLIEFARGRKQITTIDRKLLETPVSKTNTNLALEDYLLTRISRAKTSKGQRRILFTTLYKEIHLTTSKQQQRIKKPLIQILDFYKARGFVDGYTIDEKGIIFSFSTKKLAEKT